MVDGVEVLDSRAILERIARDNEKFNPDLAAKIALGLMPYDHSKKSDIGKKEAKENAAQQVAKGKGQRANLALQRRPLHYYGR